MRLLVETFLRVCVYGLLLFLPALTLGWWRAWVLLSLAFAAMLITRLWAFHNKDGLLDERRKGPMQPGQPFADKLIVVGFLVIVPAYVAFIPIDVFHLHLVSRPDIIVSSFGMLLVGCGWWIVALAFRENAFALAIVRDQAARKQTVVDTGVYSVVRHPLYSGVVLILVGIALWLESSAAAAFSVVPISLVIMRIRVEEEFLRGHLGGYSAYAGRVPHRLIPRIW